MKSVLRVMDSVGRSWAKLPQCIVYVHTYNGDCSILPRVRLQLSSLIAHAPTLKMKGKRPLFHGPVETSLIQGYASRKAIGTFCPSMTLPIFHVLDLRSGGPCAVKVSRFDDENPEETGSWTQVLTNCFKGKNETGASSRSMHGCTEYQRCSNKAIDNLLRHKKDQVLPRH